MKQRIIITSEELKRRAVAILQALPLDPCHEIIVREWKRDRSAAQNSLLWKWYTVIGAELGESKESIHEQMKEKFLTNIYTRDNPDYSEMMESLRHVYREGMRDEALGLRKKIIALTSTTTATVAQMQEYMTSIDHFAAGLGIRLPAEEQ